MIALEYWYISFFIMGTGKIKKPHLSPGEYSTLQKIYDDNEILLADTTNKRAKEKRIVK